MKKNVGIADKVIRLLIAAVIGILFYNQVITGVMGIILLIVAGILILTVLAGFCPLYRLFGISSCKVKAPSRSNT